MHLVTKRPMLLTRSTASVARVIAALSTTLRMATFDVAVMMCTNPGILGVAPEKLAQRCVSN